jgi:hypothetical protein
MQRTAANGERTGTRSTPIPTPARTPTALCWPPLCVPDRDAEVAGTFLTAAVFLPLLFLEQRRWLQCSAREGGEG